ncbi:MAG: hypothetical protein IT379_20405 [Deltaproteobacteria bacterium]|nr:hypothetical protein [Deltaproteobacteria bacterium]
MVRPRQIALCVASIAPLAACSALIDLGGLSFDGPDAGTTRTDLGLDATHATGDAGDAAMRDVAMRDVSEAGTADVREAAVGDARDDGDARMVACTGERTCHQTGGMLGVVPCAESSRASCLDGVTAPFEGCACPTLPAIFFEPPSGTGGPMLRRVIAVAPSEHAPYSVLVRTCPGNASVTCEIAGSCGGLYRVYVWDVEVDRVAEPATVTLWQSDDGAPCCAVDGPCAGGEVAMTATWTP